MRSDDAGSWSHLRWTVLALSLWYLLCPSTSRVAIGAELSQESQLKTQSNPLFSSPVPPVIALPAEQKPAIAKPLLIQGNVKIDQAPILLDTLEIEGNRVYRTGHVYKALKPLHDYLDTHDDQIDAPTLEKIIGDINATHPFKLRGRLSQDEAIHAERGQDLTLEVNEPEPFRLSAFTDNAGRPGSGLYRWGLEASHASVTGHGDTLYAQYIQAQTSYFAQTGYTSMPLNRRDGTIKVNFSFQHVDYLTDLLSKPAPSSHADVYITSLRWNQPLDKAHHWLLFNQLSYARLNTWTDSFLTYNSDYGTILSGLSVAIPDRWGKTNVEISTAYGISNDKTRSQYWRQRAQINRLLTLPKHQTLSLRGLGQATNDYLPIGFDVVTGGATSVRGYTEGLINGDRGYIFNAEYQAPIPFLNRASGWLHERLRWVAFADVGQAWRDVSNTRFVTGKSNKADATLLAAFGFGLRGRLTQFCQGYVDFGFGVLNRNNLELLAQPTFRTHFGIRSDLVGSPVLKEHNQERHRLFDRYSSQPWGRH